MRAESYPPSEQFQKQANLSKEQFEKWRAMDSEAYWAEASKDLLWDTPWTKVLESEPPFYRWFPDGKINACTNALDRHLPERAQQKAILWENELGHRLEWTYEELYERTCRLANVLEKDLGVKAGDRVCLYLPLIPEAIAAMLACARIGAIHCVVFAGFSAPSLKNVLADAGCKVLLTADSTYRKGQEIDLLSPARLAALQVPTLEKILLLQRTEVRPLQGKEVDWRHLSRNAETHHTAAAFPSEHPLFFLYTSGTTGKPKGIIHSTGGYLTGVLRSTQGVLDVKPGDHYWCTADIGWVTGHSYIVYGPLMVGATLILHEGTIQLPHPGILWERIQRDKVGILYTAPTAIRALKKEGEKLPEQYDLSSLRLLGTVGEPIGEEAWRWYHEKVGRSQCPIVDTWWQTETGSILMSPLPAVHSLKPGSAMSAIPGVEVDIVDEKGSSLPPQESGYLVIKKPWPSMLRGIYADSARYEAQYWKKFPGWYLTGDGARRDADGHIWIEGRIDDVLNVSGHRLGTREIESALTTHPRAAEAAVIGVADPLKGQAVAAFVVLKSEAVEAEKSQLIDELKKQVVSHIGALARPDKIFLVRALPKTRSGKILRRILRDLADGREVQGDLSSLEGGPQALENCKP